MYKRCKTEQSAARQRRLELGLLDAMLVSHFDEISVSDLCDRLQVSRKSFYRYFSDKQGALKALIDHTLMQYDMKNIHVMGQRDLVPALELESYFRFWLEQKPLLDALQRSGLSNILLERAIDYALTQGMEQKELPAGGLGAREYGMLFGVSGLMTMVLRWHRNGYREPTKLMALYAEQALTKPYFGQRL